MEEANTSFIVVLLFILRCLIPLIILLGISYLLRRFGLIPESSKEKSTKNGGINKEGGLNQTNAV